jgi:hypothetical protein
VWPPVRHGERGPVKLYGEAPVSRSIQDLTIGARMPEDSEPGSTPEKASVAKASQTDEPLVKLSDRARHGIAFVLVVLAIVHVIWPGLAIDAVFLGLLAFAAVVLLFDIDAVEWLGISAKRRRAREQAAITAADARVQNIEVQPVSPKPLPAPEATSASSTAAEEPSTGLLDEVSHREPFDLSPPAGPLERLLWATDKIRIDLIVIAGGGGQLPRGQTLDQYRAIELATMLAAKDMIPADLVVPVRTVVRNRNAAAHGTPLGEDVIESAADLAIDVLLKLRQVSRNYIRVESFPIELFRDQSLTARHAATGLMISQLDSDGRELHRAVYPTQSTYKRGRFVTWEWSFESVHREPAWYFDPRTKTAKQAFSSSALFSGREFPDQWGIKYHLRVFHLDH